MVDNALEPNVMQSEVIEKLGYADTQPNPKFEVMAAFVKEQVVYLWSCFAF